MEWLARSSLANRVSAQQSYVLFYVLTTIPSQY